MTAPLIFDLSKVDPELRKVALSPEYRDWFTKFPEDLLGVDTNAKTIKGQSMGVKTAILYFAPADMSGYNVCPMAELAGCKAACLFTAGRGGMDSVAVSRLRKTLYFHQYREQFLAQLKKEIARLVKRSKKQGWILLVRLNGTSDIRWENYGIPQAFPETQFYDYTKIANRRDIPSNYDLTFSFSGVKGYERFVSKAIAQGMRVAAVFRTKETVADMVATGATFQGLAVVSGDDTDVRHLDPQGVIVALYAKGAAKKDKSGFVVG